MWAAVEGLSRGGHAGKDTWEGLTLVDNIGSPWAWPARNSTPISSPSSLQSNASHLLLMLFPLAPLQIVWKKHGGWGGGQHSPSSSYCLCHIPSLLLFLHVPSPFITLINNLYLIGLSWSSQIGLLGSCRDHEENNSDRPSTSFVFCCFPGWMEANSKHWICNLREEIWK